MEEAQLEGFESATLRRRYPERLVSLAAKLCRRTYHVMQSVQVCCEYSLKELFDILENTLSCREFTERIDILSNMSLKYKAPASKLS